MHGRADRRFFEYSIGISYGEIEAICEVWYGRGI